MPLAIAIVGLPNVGKSTLFNSLTNNKAEASNYPFCTIDPNVGVVKVPDERLDKLAAVSCPKKIIPTVIEFVDVAGLVRGASNGQGLGNKFLSHIRECDAICEVVRVFKDEKIIHVSGEVNPKSDAETVDLELIFADLNTVEKRLEKAASEAKSGSEEKIKEKDFLGKIKAQLDAGHAVREIALPDEEKKIIRSLNLLTMKPIIYVLNSNEKNLSAPLYKDNQARISPAGREEGASRNGEFLTINARLEEEISALPEAERAEYVRELGLHESGLDKLIKASYKLLGLVTFFTTGPDETRAWTVRGGTKAPQAAGAIHTDFEKGFIRAEIISWQDFISAGSEHRARELGLLRTEGKDYVMRDGDVCHFLVSK